MRRVLAAPSAVLAELDPVRIVSLVFLGLVVTPLTVWAGERNLLSYCGLGHADAGLLASSRREFQRRLPERGCRCATYRAIVPRRRTRWQQCGRVQTACNSGTSRPAGVGAGWHPPSAGT